MIKVLHTTQNMKYSIKDFFSISGQICSFLNIFLLHESLMEHFNFFAVAAKKQFWETVRLVPSHNVESSEKIALVNRDQTLAWRERCTIFKFDLLKRSKKSSLNFPSL